MTFSTIFDGLLKVKELFPYMKWEATQANYGPSYLTITIEISDENAELLLQAQKMFAPREVDFDY